MFIRTKNTEYAVDPLEVAKLLAASLPDEEFDTGILGEDIISVWQQGSRRVVASYRKPQLTGIWFEGSADPVRVPMPGLVLVRTTHNFKNPSYSLYAVPRRPGKNSKLYHTPLPNVGGDGTCWGTVARPPESSLKGTDLSLDWQAWLGSMFGNHTTDQKSKKHKNDVRALLIELHDNKAKRYPNHDLIPFDKTLGEMLTKMQR